MKHHNNLTDDQIHVPKGFSLANNNSLLTKNSSGSIQWQKCNYTTSLVVNCIADIEGNLHHRYFCLYNSNDAIKYAVYLQISNTDVLATPSGYGGVIACNVTASGNNSTATQIGDAIQVAVDAVSGFTATDNNAGVVTITGMTTATDATDVNTGFTLTPTQTKQTNEILTTDSSGNIVWVNQTSLLSDTIEFQGYGAINDNFNLLKGFENTQDGKFGEDYGSDTASDITPKLALRSGRFIAARNYYLNRWTGVSSNTTNDVVTIELWKVTPADDSSANLTITVLKSTTITGAGNNSTRTFDLDLTEEANRTITKGDIVLCAVKNDDASATFYLNSSLRLEYKI